MVSAAVPDEVSVNVFVVLVFTATSPNASVLALKVSCADGGDAPIPLRFTLIVLPVEELVEIVTAPLAAPATVGLKLNWSVMDLPGFNVAGNVGLDIENPPPTTLTELTVNIDFPEDVSVSVLVDVVFRGAVPNDRALLLTVNSTAAEAGLITTAPQPQSTHARLKAAARQSPQRGRRRRWTGSAATAFDRSPDRIANGRAARKANELLTDIDGCCT
jgi:hypothetical protein